MAKVEHGNGFYFVKSGDVYEVFSVTGGDYDPDMCEELVIADEVTRRSAHREGYTADGTRIQEPQNHLGNLYSGKVRLHKAK